MAQANPTSEQALIAMYVWAEGALLDGLAQIMRRLATVPADLRAALGRMLTRRLTARVAGVLNQQTPGLVDRLMPGPPDAAPPGGRGPGAPYGGQPPGQPPGRPYGADAVAKIRADLVSELDDVRFRITRLDDDMYKLVAPEHAITQVSGATPQEAQADAWRDFIRRGVTGFTDKSGRRWQLSSYVEMAVRTATNRARNAARIDQITAAGGNLVYVSDDGHPCPLCYPWQHRVLAITPDGQHPTIEDATIAGLFHPNCRHTVMRYFPGITRLPPTQPWTPQMQAAYDATQKQRTLERRIRAAKRDAAYGATPDARAAARGDVRDAQAKLRAHLADNADLNLLRRPRREQPNLSMK